MIRTELQLARVRHQRKYTALQQDHARENWDGGYWEWIWKSQGSL